MKRLGLLLTVAMLLAACGGDDRGPAPEKADTTPSISPKVAQLRELCARTMQAKTSVAGYEKFVRDLKRLGAPEQAAVQGRMLEQVRSAGTAAAIQKAYAADDAIDARMGLIDCIRPDSAAALTSPQRICADNRARTARARSLASDAGDAIDEAGSERLARLIVATPRPADDSPEYGGWTDSLKTAANLYRLADGTKDDTRAKALREQAERTSAAARKTAGALGLAECAKP